MRARRAAGAAWPRLPPGLVARLLAGHSAVGLVFCAAVHLVCLTGTLAVFADDLALVEAPAPAVTLRPGAIDRAAREATARLGGAAAAPSFFLVAPTAADQRWTVRSGERQWRIGPDGTLRALRTPWTDFVTDLHMTLALPPPWGLALVGVVGVGLLSLLLSGLLAHPRILKDAFALRLGANRRLREADLHNRLGVWGLPFHLAVALTGAFLGLSSLLLFAVAALGFHGDVARAIRPLRGPPAAADPRPAPPPALQPLVERAEALRPGGRLSYVGVEKAGTAGARITVAVTAPGRLPRGDEAWFDQAGHLVGRGRYASGPVGLQLYSGAAQVHFGGFGGLPVRVAYGVLGLGLTWVSASGTSIWLARRRDRGRPAPRLERAWLAWTWGAPAALVLAEPLACAIPPAAVFWTLAAALQAAALAWPAAA